MAKGKGFQRGLLGLMCLSLSIRMNRAPISHCITLLGGVHCLTRELSVREVGAKSFLEGERKARATGPAGFDLTFWSNRSSAD